MDSNLTTHKVNRDSTQNQNLHGRRITGAGASQGPNDYVTRRELDSAISGGNSTVQIVQYIGSSTPTPSTGSGSIILEQVLTTGYTVVVPTIDYIGEILTVCLTQDSSGGHSVTWPSNFKLAPKINDKTANTINIITFVARIDGNWWLSGLPILGRHI